MLPKIRKDRPNAKTVRAVPMRTGPSARAIRMLARRKDARVAGARGASAEAAKVCAVPMLVKINFNVRIARTARRLSREGPAVIFVARGRRVRLRRRMAANVPMARKTTVVAVDKGRSLSRRVGGREWTCVRRVWKNETVRLLAVAAIPGWASVPMGCVGISAG